jgi:hypothetical protein
MVENRAKNGLLMVGGVNLTLPAFEDLLEKKLFFGTTDFEVGNDIYQGVLNDIPANTKQEGSGKDTAEFVVSDKTGEIFALIDSYDEVIEDCYVETFEGFEVADKVFDIEIITPGFIEDYVFSDKGNQLSFSVVSDMSRTGFLTGGWILTHRFCAARFNRNGLRSPLVDHCGHQTAQGGNPVFCSHRREGVDGCIAHNNEPRIKMVDELATAELITVANSSDIGGTGFGYGSNGCFTPLTQIVMADGSAKPIYKVKKGDVIKTHNLRGEIENQVVLTQMRHKVESILELEFFGGYKIETTLEHLFRTQINKYTPAGLIEIGETSRARIAGKVADKVLGHHCLIERNTFVYNLHVFKTHTFFIRVGNADFEVHNSKNEFPMLIGGAY